MCGEESLSDLGIGHRGVEVVGLSMINWTNGVNSAFIAHVSVLQL